MDAETMRQPKRLYTVVYGPCSDGQSCHRQGLEHINDPARNPSIILRLLAGSIHWNGRLDLARNALIGGPRGLARGLVRQAMLLSGPDPQEGIRRPNERHHLIQRCRRIRPAQNKQHGANEGTALWVPAQPTVSHTREI